ncbi:hypothetical protein SAMN02799630_04310 [Paenibacillus sp. UNCCL117]|uniref:hypothetical protein n=1 Tax=unclassified Paenibacillus TaxID=185978 RepID=UPI00088DFC3F|nr:MULTISPECIES: hypothetical protein [unclassified Paenibacillus]SDD97868.1 hypothetical protein SAMN04488602_11684 [Paenibacillus sp. cl123]SFW56090.1 hypothetical protein SAMN02799630_04310 [Paenibacillus sp. UNCCL117]
MSISPRIETEEDIQLIKDYTLLPILLDMLARDIDELQLYKDKIVYHHVIFHLSEIENAVRSEVLRLKKKMRAANIIVLTTDMNASGIEVEYKVRGYIHHFKMLRSLVKAELSSLLADMRRRSG